MASVTTRGSGSFCLQRLRSHGQAVLHEIGSTSIRKSRDVKRHRHQVGQLCDFDKSRLEEDQCANLGDAAEAVVLGKKTHLSLAEMLKLYGAPSDVASGAEPTTEPTAADMASHSRKGKHIRGQTAKTQPLKHPTPLDASNDRTAKTQPLKQSKSLDASNGDGYQGKKVIFFSSPESALNYLLRLEQRK
eukprot:TRINITY_DN58251_c0_g1_i1.p1 TRINITY_DN58251_c0_g1~~TRINITY_DN58251_c0_g1_i1.p1  ORF type:complete len:189 (-),score=33.24 TRINITY_DN58251_c0_g1_i1:387-953(-)